jgi:hypothetical protein
VCVPPPPPPRGGHWTHSLVEEEVVGANSDIRQKLWHSVYSVVFFFCEMVGIPSFYIFCRMARNDISRIFRSAKQTEFQRNESKFLSVLCSAEKNFLRKWQPSLETKFVPILMKAKICSSQLMSQLLS